MREEVFDMNHNGASQREIARELKTSRCFLFNMSFHITNTQNSSIARPKSQPPKTTVTLDVINCIEMEKSNENQVRIWLKYEIG